MLKKLPIKAPVTLLAGCVLFLYTAAGFAQQLTSGGPNCVAALTNITLLPAAHLNETTCGALNDYSSANVQPCGDFTYTSGQDKIYAIQPAVSGNIIIYLTAANVTDNDVAIFLYEGCPDAGSCVAFNTAVSEASNIKVMGADVTSGKTYYLMVDRQKTTPTDCINAYQLIITEPSAGCPALAPTVDNKSFNADFETGALLNWTATTGTCCPINAESPGIVTGRHTIMTGSDTDPFTNGEVPVVAPGNGKYSARLGDSNTGNEAEKLKYKFKVTDDLNAVIYQYAVILEDPSHQPDDQPRFEIRVFDEIGNSVSCGQYRVVSGPGITCFKGTGTGIIYKNWTTVGIDLRPYIGQNITVEYATGDCKLGGHFGYAYLDVSITKLALQVLSQDSSLNTNGYFCLGDTVLELSAPDGFDKYTWSLNGNPLPQQTSKITVNNPQPGDKYTCELTPVTGFSCNSNIQITLNAYPRPVADFSHNAGCVLDEVQFSDLSSIAIADTIASWAWDFGDGTTSSAQNPGHLYTSPGTYNVTLTATGKRGCSHESTKQVTLIGRPVFTMSATDTLICAGNPATISANVPSGGSYTYQWNNSMSGSSITVNPLQTTDYIVEVASAGYPSCSSTDTITVEVKQVLSEPQISCGNIDSNSIEFIWNPVMESVGYEISLDGGNTWQVPNSGISGMSHTVNNLQSGQQLNIRVRALGNPACRTSQAGEKACTTSGIVTVPPEEYYFYLPNSFSPNGDGENDTFKPLHKGVTMYNLVIFDRWGKKVFQTNDITHEWAGSVQDETTEKIAPGVYIYIVDVNDRDGNISKLAGTVSIIR